MSPSQIINVLNLAKYNQLEKLQWKVEYLANEVNALEQEKANCEKHLTLLNMRRDECMQSLWALEISLAQKREELALSIYYMILFILKKYIDIINMLIYFKEYFHISLVKITTSKTNQLSIIALFTKPISVLLIAILVLSSSSFMVNVYAQHSGAATSGNAVGQGASSGAATSGNVTSGGGNLTSNSSSPVSQKPPISPTG